MRSSVVRSILKSLKYPHANVFKMSLRIGKYKFPRIMCLSYSRSSFKYEISYKNDLRMPKKEFVPI